MEQIFAPELLKYGLLGLIIVYLLRRNGQLELEVQTLQKQKDELYEVRIVEGAKTVSTLALTTMANEKLAATVDKVGDELRDLHEAVMRLPK
jgi:hypothetical protein